MRAFLRSALAPLFAAAAILFAGATAHTPAAAASQHPRVAAFDCPGGTSWDNILRICR